MRFLALFGGKDAVVIDIHLVEMREERGFELLPGHRLDTGEPPLQEAQRMPADARGDISAGHRPLQQQFRAESLWAA